MREIHKAALIIIIVFLFIPGDVSAQNIYELHKFTDDDWLKFSTEERLQALNISNNHARNQTFVGRFGRYQDLYPKWGYDYYEMEDRYENYAFRGFENYNIIEDRRHKWYYNQFGDRLTKMTTNAQIWSETMYDDGTTYASGPGGYINRLGDTDGIWVARESTDDWAISAVGAGALRTKLTPLTMSLPGLNGMQVNFQSSNYMARMVNSVMYVNSLTQNAAMLRGMQFRRKFGALTLGATFSNMYSIQRNRDKGDDIKGHVSNYAPTPIYYAVRIVDDSPQDGDGPIVHDVKLRVNGVYRPDIKPQIIIDDLRKELITAITNKSEKEYLEPTTSTQIPISFDMLSLDERLPKYLDYIYMNEYTNGWNTKNMTDNFNIEKGKEYYQIIDPGGKPVKISGNEYVVYLFDLASVTDKVNRVEAEVTVANDYRIQVSQIMTKLIMGGHDSVGNNFMHYSAQYWTTVAQADGNIKDGSNLRTVSVDFGYEVGNMIYGFDAHFNYLGFKLNGEFVTNNHYYMFSDGKPGKGLPSFAPLDITPRDGYRSSLSDHAYYFTVEKDWHRFGFAGELFKMGKFYRPSFNYYLAKENISYSITGEHTRNNIIRMSMIEDNDDDDQYPDTMYQSSSMAYELLSLTDPDGVFPGNDNDHDGYPDNEKNDNNIPDYYEPFLMFDVDPDEFVFGDDFNNNSIPDFREDDMKYDTPYDLDRKGHHFYVRFSPYNSVNLMLGSFRTRGIGLDNRTDDDYFKVNINYDIVTVGKIFAEYRHERIKDNIQDKFVIVPTDIYMRDYGGWIQLSRYKRELFYDEVQYRNSKVNKFFLESKIRAIPSITLENHVKYENNEQIEGTMYDNTFQAKDVLSTLAVVNKIAYTKQLGNWTFSPGIKYRLYKLGRSESLNPLDHYMMRIPLVYLKYTISPQTNITFGTQGFKGFELQYKDYIQSHNDYREINYIIQVQSNTTYFGFNVNGMFGFEIEQVKFEEKYRKFEEYKSSSFFVKIFLGY